MKDFEFGTANGSRKAILILAGIINFLFWIQPESLKLIFLQINDLGASNLLWLLVAFQIFNALNFIFLKYYETKKSTYLIYDNVLQKQYKNRIELANIDKSISETTEGMEKHLKLLKAREVDFNSAENVRNRWVSFALAVVIIQCIVLASYNAQ